MTDVVQETETRRDAPAGAMVQRWLAALQRIGLADPERASHLDALRSFCAREAVEPEDLPARWLEFPELVARRTGVGAPNVPVESFLVHSGVNIFGDLVCVPTRAEHLADQWR